MANFVRKQWGTFVDCFI